MINFNAILTLISQNYNFIEVKKTFNKQNCKHIHF